jgi:hypothetical protein
MPEHALPSSVRYVKNGEGGRWWKTAKERAQVHLGWSGVPRELLERRDLRAIEALPAAIFGTKPSASTRDRRALMTLLDRPSQHLWITFQDGFLWWTTVGDRVEVNPEGESREQGHFWLVCNRPWSNRSLGGKPLATADLPGTATTTAGFQGTVCEPAGWRTILRLIQDEQHPDAAAASVARQAYKDAVGKLVAHLYAKDFEVLIDLILSRSGWARIAKLGGATEGVDVEAENATTGEIAFVQVKSVADQRVLADYIERFQARRERYARMIFAVHSPRGDLHAPGDLPVHVWDLDRIADLVVALGLGDWVARHL